MKKMIYLFLMLIVSCSVRHKDGNFSFEEINPIILEFIFSHPEWEKGGNKIGAYPQPLPEGRGEERGSKAKVVVK